MAGAFEHAALDDSLFLTPPELLAIVTEGIYRCASVDFQNLGFLRTLRLRTLLTLTPEPPSKALQTLLRPPTTTTWRHTPPIHASLEAWNTRHSDTIATLRKALRLLHESPKPVLIVDPIGLFCGIVRRWQGWNYTSIILEYRSFAGSKARYAVEEFLEGVDTTSLRAKDPNETSTADPDEFPTSSQHKALEAHSTPTQIS